MGPFIEGYGAWLTKRGYSPGTVIHLLAMAGALGRWMDTRGIVVGDLNRAVIAEFRSAGARRECGVSPVPTGWTALLEFLGQQGAAGGVGSLPGRSKSWWSVIGGGLSGARAGRGHGPAVCEAGAPVLDAAFERIGALCGKPHRDRHCRVPVAESERLSVGSVKGRVAELRSLLKFLYLHGLTPRLLSHGGAAGGRLARHRGAESDPGGRRGSCCWAAAIAATRSAFVTSRC